MDALIAKLAAEAKAAVDRMLRLVDARAHGWVPSGHRPTSPNRPLWARQHARVGVTMPPLGVDMRPAAPPARSQFSSEGCTGFAGAFWFSTLHGLAREFVPPPEFSAQFPWIQERIAEGTYPQNTGCSLADDVQVFAQLGDCLLATLPDDNGSPSDEVTAAARAEALNYRLDPLSIARVDVSDLGDVDDVLAARKPILLAVNVYESLFQFVGNSGLVDAWPNLGDLVGGHAVFCVGKRADGRYIVGFRSWAGFGDDGWCYLSPDAWRQIVAEGWVGALPAGTP